ncbi:MAG TPA: shikimate kinase [Anaeromyxobacteraceae bacterium]|nr:shikimate kinase [Anaeromyxobacteraceae bacterium]
MALRGDEALALAGMMGAGKSTVAELLARWLRRRVVSTDALLVERFGKPIPRIFAEDGEPAFRQAEREVVAAMTGPVVVDLGGGAFCDPVSAERLLRTARVVFLDVSEREALRRISGGDEESNRPLAARWRALRAQRDGLYRRAHLTVSVTGFSPEAVARRILGLL